MIRHTVIFGIIDAKRQLQLRRLSKAAKVYLQLSGRKETFCRRELHLA